MMTMGDPRKGAAPIPRWAYWTPGIGAPETGDLFGIQVMKAGTGQTWTDTQSDVDDDDDNDYGCNWKTNSTSSS